MSLHQPKFKWDDLMDCIEERRVIPVVGKELLTISVDGKKMLLESWLARRLAEKLSIDVSQLAENFSLNEIVLLHLEHGGDRLNIYSGLKSIIRTQPPPVPESLDKLAKITNFQLYISLTFDSLLKQALDNVRYSGEKRTQSLLYSTSRKYDDLPDTIEKLKTAYVYHLFGRLSSAADYAVSDEDYLEFTHRLQSASRHPTQLFDELREHHLLFIGCGFQNWLERFLVRTVSNNRLLNQTSNAFLADGHAMQDASLTVFLKHYQTEIYPSGNATKFVDKLYDRWQQANPSLPSEVSPPAQPVGNSGKMEPDAVFVSYASEDRDAARRMNLALDKAGIDVWFDKNALKYGNDWDRVIQANIRHCSFFVPLISRHASSRLEGYFRREWNWAISRDGGIDMSRNFIRPVIIDDTDESATGIPGYFWKRHGAWFADGQPSEEFVTQLKKDLRKLRKHEAHSR